jgi:hypothetical protein
MQRPRREALSILRDITVALAIGCLVSVPALVVGASPPAVAIGAFGGPDRVVRAVVAVIGGSAFQLDQAHAYMAMDVPAEKSLPIVVRDATTCRKLGSVTGRVGSHDELVFGADGFRRIADRGASGWDASLVVPPRTTRCLLPESSISSAAGPAASPTSSSVTPPAWGRVPFEAGLRDPFGSSSIVAVTAGPSGILAVGWAPTGAAAWRSVDGLSWQRALQPASWDRATLNDVTATPTGYLAVGSVDVSWGGHPRSSGAAWASDDGLQWRRMATGVGTDLTRVTTGDAGLVAIARGAEGGDEIMESTDGVAWRTIRQATGRLDLAALLADGSLRLAGGAGFDPKAGWHAAIIVSIDAGATWRDATFKGDPTGSVEDIVRFGDGYVAVGQGGTDQAAAWMSPDGMTWARTEQVPYAIFARPYSDLVSVTVGADGSLLAAIIGGGRAGVVTSHDGVTWRSVPFPSDAEPPASEVVATGVIATPQRDLVVGEFPDGPRGRSAAVWSDPGPDAVATDGEWLTTCPEDPPDILALAQMDPQTRLDCFGRRSLTFRAWLAPGEYGELEGAARPVWLTEGIGGVRGLAASSVTGRGMGLQLDIDPGGPVGAVPRTGRWAVVTGHFDDPAAKRCPTDLRDVCRQAFVLSAVR